MCLSAGSAPSSSPAASPWVGRRHSPWPPARSTFPGIGVASPSVGLVLTATRPASTRLEPVPRLRGFNHWFTLVTPVCLACRARAVWQCRPTPSLSGLLAALPCTSRVRLPSASTGLLRQTGGGSFHPARYMAPRGARAGRARGTQSVGLARWRSKVWLHRSGWVGPPSSAERTMPASSGLCPRGEAFLQPYLPPSPHHGDGLNRPGSRGGSKNPCPLKTRIGPLPKPSSKQRCRSHSSANGRGRVGADRYVRFPSGPASPKATRSKTSAINNPG